MLQFPNRFFSPCCGVCASLKQATGSLWCTGQPYTTCSRLLPEQTRYFLPSRCKYSYNEPQGFWVAAGLCGANHCPAWLYHEAAPWKSDYHRIIKIGKDVQDHQVQRPLRSSSSVSQRFWLWFCPQLPVLDIRKLVDDKEGNIYLLVSYWC